MHLAHRSLEVENVSFVAVTTGSFSDQNLFMINLVKGVLIRFNEIPV